jgi:chemotaxis-related protein WspB
MQQSPPGVAGVFNFRGRPVPALDLTQYTLGRPASERLSTRIVIVNYTSPQGDNQLIGLIAENATEMLRKDETEFIDPGMNLTNAAFLGPILMDSQGSIQRIHIRRLLSEQTRAALFLIQNSPAHAAL